MSLDAIEIENLSLDFPRQPKGGGMLRELLTGRFRKNDQRARWFRALDGLNLHVSPGEVVGIIGPNGGGKSTLLRVIAGIYAPDEGRVLTRGRVTLLSGVGTGFQRDLTGRENIHLTGSIHGFEVITFAGIGDFIDQPLRTYSSGMRARLGFSIISHMEPDILLLDEVMSVGDHDFKTRSRKRIEEMVQGDATVVIVSHSVSLLRQQCDRVHCLVDGKLVTDGDKEAAFECYHRSEEEE
jgi:ABC-type polysaccharide/polyol phosphate transport system ATPase subunit